MKSTRLAQVVATVATITAVSAPAALAKQPARWPTVQITHFKAQAAPPAPERITVTGSVRAGEEPQTFCSRQTIPQTATARLDTATVNNAKLLDIGAVSDLSELFTGPSSTYVVLRLAKQAGPACVTVSTWLPHATVRLRLTAFS